MSMGSQETELPLLSGIGDIPDMRRDMSTPARMSMGMRGPTDMLGTSVCLRVTTGMLLFPKIPMGIALALSMPPPDAVPTAPALSRPLKDISIAHALSRPLPFGDSTLPLEDARGKGFD